MSPSYARPARPARHVTFALLAFLFGCAPQADALRREFGELKHDVASVRAENAALRERIDALEEKGAPAPVPDSAPSSSAVSATDDRPELKVVRISPEASQSDGWVAVDPSDPKRPRPASSAPSDGPTTEIRSERGGAVMQRSTPATTVAPRK